MLKAINIKWDTDGDEKVLQDLPTEMIIPDYLEEYYYKINQRKMRKKT